MPRPRPPRLAVWKFASCDGCQLSLLDCEDQLLALAGVVEIAHFPEATRAEVRGPYDISLVEGSITTAHDAERIRQVRGVSRFLVSIGACACSGGIQALRNLRDLRELVGVVYAQPEYIDTLPTSTAIADHVRVDAELRGCPVDKHQLVELLNAFLHDRRPRIAAEAVCTECKRRGIPCVMVSAGIPCLGPVTHAGCGALCPAHHRGCYGCFGPAEDPNTAALAARMAALGMDERDLVRAFTGINASAGPFRREGEAHAV